MLFCSLGHNLMPFQNPESTGYFPIPAFRAVTAVPENHRMQYSVQHGYTLHSHSHFCSAEVAAQASCPLAPVIRDPPFPVSAFVFAVVLAAPQDASEDAIEDLAGGLDILLILERAYERALKVHVIAPSAQALTPCLRRPGRSSSLPDPRPPS